MIKNKENARFGLMTVIFMLLTFITATNAAIDCNAQVYSSNTDPYILLNCSGFPSPSRSYITSVAYSTNGSDVDKTHTLAWYAGLSGGDGSGNMIKTITLQPGQIFDGYYTVVISGLGQGKMGVNRAGPFSARVLVNGTGAFTGLWTGGEFPSSGYPGSLIANLSNRENVTFNGGSGFFSVTVQAEYTYFTGYIDHDYNMEGVASYVRNSTGGFLIKDFYLPGSGKCTGGTNCNGVNLQICNTTTNTWQDSVVCSSQCGAPVGGCSSNISGACSVADPPKCQGADLQVCSSGAWVTQVACYAGCPGKCYGPGAINYTYSDVQGNINSFSPYSNGQALGLLNGGASMQINQNLSSVSFRMIDVFSRSDYAPQLSGASFNINASAVSGVACNLTSGIKTINYPVYSQALEGGCAFIGGNTSGVISVTISANASNNPLPFSTGQTFYITVGVPNLALSAPVFSYNPQLNGSSWYRLNFNVLDLATQGAPSASVSCSLNNTGLGVALYNQDGSLNQTLAVNSSYFSYSWSGSGVFNFGFYPDDYANLQWVAAPVCNASGYATLSDKSPGGYPINSGFVIYSVDCYTNAPIGGNQNNGVPAVCRVELLPGIMPLILANPNQITVSISDNAAVPAGYKLGTLARFGGSLNYSPYIIYPSSFGSGSTDIFFTGANWQDMSYQRAEGSYLYFTTPDFRLTQGAPTSGQFQLYNVKVSIPNSTYGSETYGFIHGSAVNTPVNSLKIGSAVVKGQALSSGDMIECEVPFSDPQDIIGSVSAQITGSSKLFTFDNYDITGNYTLSIRGVAPGDAYSSNYSYVAYLRVPNWGGCSENMSTANECNGSMNSYAFGYRRERGSNTVPFTCQFVLYDKFGGKLGSNVAASVFTNTLTTPVSQAQDMFNAEDFSRGIVGWVFASSENFVITVGFLMSIIIGMPMLVMLLAPGWNLFGKGGNEGGN
jgi:hypothetical protein